MGEAWDEVQSVPEVQTEQTVRAFSGMLRRISAGGGVDDEEDDDAVWEGAAAEKASAHRHGNDESCSRVAAIRLAVHRRVVILIIINF